MPHPVIDAKCKGNEKCLLDALDVCPTQVFAKEGDKVIVKNPKECIGCRACETQCEHGEIKVID